jgi:WD40 repeat protein
MAPEQARGEGVDHRADLFSLGSVLYALCTGHPPFRATGNMATLKRVCDDTPRPIQQINPSVPEWLVALIDRLHAKDPANRFQSAKEVAELLAGYLAHLQGPSRAPLPAFTSARARTGSKQRRRLLTAAVVTLLLAAGALVAMPPLLKWIRSSETPPVNPGPELDLGATTITEVRRFDEGHTDHIVGLAFSPDGKRAASASVDRTIRIWEVESGKQLGILEGHTDTVVSIAFTKDGLRLFSASRDKTVRLWEVETGKDLRQFGERNEELRQVAVSPDGRFGLTAEYDQTIRLWDLDNGEQVRQFVGHTDRVYDVAFSHNGQWALSGSQDQTMRLWDVQTGQEVKRFDAHSALVHSVAFSSDDRRVASAGWDGTVRLWDVESRQQLQCYRVVEPRFNRVVFTPDGRRLLSIGHGGFLRIWDVGSDREVTQTGGHGGWAELALSRDGLFAITATADHRVRLLRLSAGEPRH